MKNLKLIKSTSLLLCFLASLTLFFTSTNTTNKSNEQIIADLSEKVASLNTALEEVKATNEMVGVNPLVGEIYLFAGDFAPRGYHLCQGQLLPISSNQALFAILGTNYGGDGRTTFALPDLRGRVPVQQGQGPGLANIRLGQKGGVVQIDVGKINVKQGTNNNTEVINRVGTENRQPFLGINYIIAGESGRFPSRS